MAKALYGFVGGPSPEHLRETATLRRRVADLENEIMRLKIENDGLLKALRERVDLVSASDLLEPLAR